MLRFKIPFICAIAIPYPCKRYISDPPHTSCGISLSRSLSIHPPQWITSAYGVRSPGICSETGLNDELFFRRAALTSAESSRFRDVVTLAMMRTSFRNQWILSPSFRFSIAPHAFHRCIKISFYNVPLI